MSDLRVEFAQHWTCLPSQIKESGTMTAVGFEPTPFRNGALSRLRPLGQTVILEGGVTCPWHQQLQ